MFSKILIANRAEIALRIIRACKEMGIRTVAVYSEADADALHTRVADEAVCIGPASATASYLNIPSIISAAEITDVEAIHPGYGFLAENAHFAEICRSCQITFIGPSPESMRLMSDKLAAKETMRKVGLPVIPGSLGAVKNKEDALKAAQKIKYPVIIKSVAGGGGKGMRICHNDVRLISALLTCQSESEAAFGRSEVYIEKYIPKARHVEVQILADKYGRTIHLGERECSIQRRYQKLIEESPSPVVTPKLRKRLGDFALKGAKAINYNNVGTMEFLIDADGNYYFIEMNTRIQVEHPVTEMVTGVDLIKQQIKMAAGEKLKLKQDDVNINGWSLECRINSEDPENNFLPSPGKISMYHPPGGFGVRVDSHVYSGYIVSADYDSLLTKLITYAKTRQEAIRTMQRALEEFVIEPLKTTIPFYRDVFTNPDFLEGEFYTDFVDNLLGEAE